MGVRAMETEEAEQRDLQIINERADALNAEAEDALGYQDVPNEACGTDAAAAESVFYRIYLAIEVLCTGPGDVRARLVNAGMLLVPLRKADFPDELQSDFEWIMCQLTRYPARHRLEGSIEGTMGRIQRRTGVKIAKRLLSLFERIQELRGHAVV